MFSYSIFSYQKLLSFLFVCSLQAFPIFVRQSIVAIRKSPGIRMIHQDPVISALSDRDSILPQVITSIGRPIPIKLKVASEIIAVLTFMTTINIIDEKKFGTRCFHKTRKNPAPIHFAAMMYSLFRICRTSVRTTFAILVQLVTPITNDRLRMFAFPRIACNKMIRSSVGILKKTSVNRMIISSSHTTEGANYHRYKSRNHRSQSTDQN